MPSPAQAYAEAMMAAREKRPEPWLETRRPLEHEPLLIGEVDEDGRLALICDDEDPDEDGYNLRADQAVALARWILATFAEDGG